jgi:hypothetical protein
MITMKEAAKTVSEDARKWIEPKAVTNFALEVSRFLTTRLDLTHLYNIILYNVLYMYNVQCTMYNVQCTLTRVTNKYDNKNEEPGETAHCRVHAAARRAHAHDGKLPASGVCCQRRRLVPRVIDS